MLLIVKKVDYGPMPSGTFPAATTATESSLSKACVHSTRTVARTNENVQAPKYAEVEFRPSTFVTRHLSDRSLELLRHFYSQSSKFRSPEQQATIDNTLHTSNDLVAILPTGTSKGLLFSLYAYANRQQPKVQVSKLQQTIVCSKQL